MDVPSHEPSAHENISQALVVVRLPSFAATVKILSLGHASKALLPHLLLYLLVRPVALTSVQPMLDLLGAEYPRSLDRTSSSSFLRGTTALII